MVKNKRRVIWDEEAKFQLKEIITYIRHKSPQGAETVKSEILQSTRLLGENPEICVADPLKLNNDGSYRTYTVFHYRITYKITDTTIQILRVKHTSREPLEY